MLPVFYQTHLKSQLSLAEFIFLKILLNLLQSINQVSWESLANALPIPIKFESRRKRIQRLLSWQNLTIEKILFAIVTKCLETYFPCNQIIYLVIDRTNWGCINQLMFSIVWDKRAFPIYFELLPLGSSNINEQTAAWSQVIPVLKKYKVCLLGDREFCSVKLANWLFEQSLCFCLRLKKTNLFR